MNVFIKLKILKTIHKDKLYRRQLRDLSDCIYLSDSYLIKNFRVNKAVFHQLIHILEPVVPKPQRCNGIPFPLKILITLSFLSSGSHQKFVGKDFDVNISQKSVSRFIKLIIDGLNNVLNDWIVFPVHVQQREIIKDGFYRKYHFPNTIGCLKGSYIQIVCPRDDEEIFFDKTGHYSIHAQFICDSNTKIIAICCRFGGSASNTYIWDKMNIRTFIENNSRLGESSWLVADNSYPQRAWIMTPFPGAAEGTPESQYNIIHGNTKTCIDSCISKLKGRWSCLHRRPLHYTPQQAAKIINACAILHNLCVNAGLPDLEHYVDTSTNTTPLFNEMTELSDDDVNDLYYGMEVRRQLSERIYYGVN